MNRQMMWCSVAMALVVISIAGCGGSSRPKTVPISGVVTIDGQPPGEAGKLFFTPTKAADGYALRPASGSFNAEGKYRVMSWEPDDGLVPGSYTVSVVPADPAKTVIPVRYQQGVSSGLKVDVPVDQGEVPFNVEVRSK